MKYYVRLNDVEKTQRSHYISQYLINENNGCVSGCKTGVSTHTAYNYPESQVHNDQEGFFTIEGSGWAKVGDQEFKIEPGTAFIVPAGIKHSIRRDKESDSVKVFWFHAAI